MAEKIEVIENKRIADTTYQITALCSVCNDGRTNVVKFDGYELFICKRCLEAAIRTLEDHMQDRFQLEFDKARHSQDQGMKPAPTGWKGMTQ